MAKSTTIRRTVSVGPVQILNQSDFDAFLQKLYTSPRGKPLTMSSIVVTVVPERAGRGKKPKVVFQPYWTWSGISFWG